MATLKRKRKGGEEREEKVSEGGKRGEKSVNVTLKRDSRGRRVQEESSGGG